MGSAAFSHSLHSLSDQLIGPPLLQRRPTTYGTMGSPVEGIPSKEPLGIVKPPNHGKDPATRVGPVVGAVHRGDPATAGGIPIVNDGEQYDSVPQEMRTIGLTSATFLIFNRVVGAGIFATPGTILRASGSVGLALSMWLFGSLTAIAGAAVYVEFGTALPRNGGEMIYLEAIYRHPRFLTTCTYAFYAAFLGRAADISLVFGEYVLYAAGHEVNQWNQRAVSLTCITFVLIIHGTALNWGLRLQNVLGTFKIVLLLLLSFAGIAVLAGCINIDPKPDNFSHLFEGTNSNANAIVTGLYAVIWSFTGYSNANYVMSEVKNPIRTIKIAAPLAIISVTIVYFLANIAYFSAVPKEDILNGGRIVAALFFQKVFGTAAEKILSGLIALSALGTILAIMFSQGRVVQELGREGVLPFSQFWASNKPFNAPAAGLFLQWFVSVIIILAPPPGDAFDFVLNLISYPLALINCALSGGLVYLYLSKDSTRVWAPPFRATLPVVIFFFLSNLFLVVAPLVPPESRSPVYENLPYWLHVIVSLGVFALGALYWLVWTILLPKYGNYRLERQWVVQSDGVPRAIFVKVKDVLER